MSYRVLLVDDEPIILSGIKSLINWQECDCEIVQTCRNGEQALLYIEQLQPNIVLCDINMPVMDGITLLEKAHAEYPHIVFIMLTNLEDFELARKALQLHAVDYIVKSTLEPDALEQSISVAKIESNNRARLAKVTTAAHYEDITNAQNLKETVSIFFRGYSRNAHVQTCALLEENSAMKNFSAIYIALDYSELTHFNKFTIDEEKRLYEWQRDIVEKIAQNFFEKFVLFSLDLNHNDVVLFCWDVNFESWQSKTESFSKRLLGASLNVTQIKSAVCASEIFNGVSGLWLCHKTLKKLKNYYYLNPCSYKFLEDNEQLNLIALHAGNTISQLVNKFKTKDYVAMQGLLESIINKIAVTPHEQNSALWLCRGIYDNCHELLADFCKESTENNAFYNYQNEQRVIGHLNTREKVLTWLICFYNEVEQILQNKNKGKNTLLEKAKDFIEQNTHRRITLNDVAESVSISPNYLSAQFKKQYNQNLVDYINETKIIKAEDMLKDNELLIYQISDNLGFENPYYFTRVFKKHRDITPKEYQKKHNKN